VPREDTQWKPGQSGNPKGRPKGSRNKLSEEWIRALAAKFDEHGDELLDELIQKHPTVFGQLIAKLVPKEVGIDLDTSITVNRISFSDQDQIEDK
jgi:hypothetical protein